MTKTAAVVIDSGPQNTVRFGAGPLRFGSQVVARRIDVFGPFRAVMAGRIGTWVARDCHIRVKAGENASMTAHHQTLLAKLAPKFGPQTENLAVDALGHILSGSKAARLALSKMIEAGGAVVGEIAQVRTQAAGKEGERPDLAGFDRDGRERVLIEAKFWAGLTDNQPVAYLERLPANTPSALLFVAPAARLETLWNELRRTVAKSQSGLTLAKGSEATALRSAPAGGKRHLLLTSWQAMLGRMATEAAAASESDTEKDIGQLRGLAAQQDDEAFLPLRREGTRPGVSTSHARPAASHQRRH